MEINDIVRTNVERAKRWHGEDLQGGKWTVVDWSNAAAGEMGEVCNAVKKLRRHEDHVHSVNQEVAHFALVQNIATEIGDTVLYLMLLSAYLGIDFERAIIDTFNRVSIREGFPERLPFHDTALESRERP